MVLIYIFNVPVVLANIEDNNSEDVVITIESEVQETSPQLEEVEPELQEENVDQSPSQSQLDDVLILEEEVITNDELEVITTQ